MARFTLPRDVYHGKGCLSELKNLKGKKAVLVVGGGSMKRQGFLDKAVNYLKEGGMEVQLFEGVEPDPSVETVMKGAEAMRAFEPDWIVAMGGGSPIDAAKAMWAFYEYPEISFEDLITPFSFPELRQKAKFAAIPGAFQGLDGADSAQYHRRWQAPRQAAHHGAERYLARRGKAG